MHDHFTYYLFSVVTISFFTMGLRIAASDGRILSPIHDWLYRNVHTNLYMPLIGCVFCMPSIWGTLLFWSYTLLFMQFDYVYIYLYITSIASASCLNGILCNSVCKYISD